MIPTDSFERHVSDWLHQDAEHRVPPHLDAVLRRTRSERQRPAWSSLERWLPVQTTARFAQVPRAAWVLIVLGLLLALGATAVLVGARPSRPLPSPFGAASTGTVLYGNTAGDIEALDTATNESRAIVTGPAIDGAPISSPDGTRFAFERRAPGGAGSNLLLADADGSNVRPLDPPISGVLGAEWSPDSDRLALVGQYGGVYGLWIVGLDGTHSLVLPESPGKDIALIREPHWRPDGRSLVFLGGPLDTVAPVGLYAIEADGTGLRALVEPAVDGSAQPAMSPDGTKVAYSRGAGDEHEIRVVDIATGADSAIAVDGGHADQRPQWSPDGRRLLFERYDGTTYRLAVAAADGGPVIEIGPKQPYQSGGSHARFSPDGTKVVAYYEADGSSWVLDPADGSAVLLDERIVSPMSWQPAAP
jgi:Tol biopolymer transport system component